MEHEEFLTPEDFKGQEKDHQEIEKMNGHPMGDGFKNDGKRGELPVVDCGEEVLGILPNGTKIYKSEDPGNSYRQSEKVALDKLLGKINPRYKKPYGRKKY